jgi:anaerobic ribonucleoside-triphosphate reductase
MRDLDDYRLTPPEPDLFGSETTDMALFVRTSGDEVVTWDRSRIVEALIRETFIDRATADAISLEVEKTITAARIKNLTSALVRELVDAKLVEYGLESARKMHTRLGVPLYDVEKLILCQNKENANIPHGPEATNLTLAESIKKEYALLSVFSEDVSEAHVKGDIHLHDLGFVDRPYCSGQSLEYIKKFGLTLPNALATAKPAKRPEVLLAHMVKFSAALQGHFAGAIGWDAVNLFFAPYIEGMGDNDIHQLAQMIVFEYSQQAVARGGQAIFSDINLYWEVPKHFEDVPAIGPGGTYTGKKYGEYGEWARKLVWALFDVYMEGDSQGRPFFFPKPLVHITEKFFHTPGHRDFLNHIAEVSSKMGNTYYVFDRGETAKISECCRLSFKLEKQDFEDAREPWKMRYSALQNVTLNLPRIAYQAKGSDSELWRLLSERMDVAAKAHIQKRYFIERLLSFGEDGPLALLTMNKDGSPYLRMGRASYLIGMVGLNELVKAHTGHEMHEGSAYLKFGLKIIAQMKILSERLSEKHGMRFILEQTPAESTAHRFAKLDLRYHSPESGHTVKGDITKGQVYYTNSTYIPVSAQMGPIGRVRTEGLFHPMIEAGSLTHLWLGEARPSASSVASFVTKVFQATANDQIAFSPEFTSCDDCGRTSRGLHASCPTCGSAEVEGITRITGYFTKVSAWNKGKLGELKDRFRNEPYLQTRAEETALVGE